jgi:Right handed beta helix region
LTIGRERRALGLAALSLSLLFAGCGGGAAAPTVGAAGIEVTARGSEATSAVARCRVDGAAWRACVSPFAAFDLASGSHVIEVEATHGGIDILRRPAATTGDTVAVVAFANAASGGAGRATVRFDVGGAPPTGSVSLRGVAQGARVRGLVAVHAQVRAGDSRIVLVDYYVDGRIAASSASAPWDAMLDYSRIAPGPRMLRAVAVALDRRRRASQPIAVTVAATHPTLSGHAVRSALQAAIDALGPDGGTLRLPAGRFPISHLRIGSGVHLIGAGANRTTLVAPDGAYEAAVAVTGRDELVSDLAIDGRGTGTGHDESAAIAVGNAQDVVLRRLRFFGLRGYGVHVEGHHQRISVQESTFEGDGRARAAVAEWAQDATSGDVSVVRCVIRDMTDYGILLQSYFGGRTWPNPRTLAYGNDVRRIVNPTKHDGTVEIGIWIAGVDGAVLDNVVRGAGWDGIETVVNAARPTIAGNVVRGGRTGIYIENVTRDASIEQNDIADVIVAGINLEPPHTGPASGRLDIRFNRVVGAGEFGIGLGPGTLGSSVTSNQVLDSGSMAILLQGASGNTVQDNDLRDRRATPRQRYCIFDPQTRGSKTSNIVSGNDCTGSRNGGATDSARYSARRGAAP